MIRRLFHPRSLAVVATAAVLCLSSPVSVAGPAPAGRGEVVIQLAADSALGLVSTVLKTVGWAVTRRAPGPEPLYVARPKGLLASVETTVLKVLALVPGVRAVEDNFLLSVDRDFGGKQSQAPVLRDDFVAASMKFQPALDLIGVRRTADTQFAQPMTAPMGPVVAVLDGGFDLRHEAFRGARLLQGFDALDGDSDVCDLGNGRDDDGNGTVDDGVGHGNAVLAVVCSVAPSARLLPIRVLDDENVASVADLAAGLHAALERGAAIVNMSVGASRTSMVLDNALMSARSRGVVVVAPAGNSGTSPMLYPASNGGVVGVVGTDCAGAKDPQSNYGNGAGLGAPSLDVVAPFPKTLERYGLWRGTSFAAPFHAAGVAVAMQATGMSAQNASSALLSGTQSYTYVPAGSERYVGAGVLDLRPYAPR